MAETTHELERLLIEARQNALASVENALQYSSLNARERVFRETYESLNLDDKRFIGELLPQLTDSIIISLLKTLSDRRYEIGKQPAELSDFPQNLHDEYEDRWLPKLKQIEQEGFWDVGGMADEYHQPLPTPNEIAELEMELGYKLPESYLTLMQSRNGGTVKKNRFPTTQPNRWAEDHIQIVGIFGIGRERDYTLGGDAGSRFWVEEWGYPDIGIYFADTPTAGHQMLVLDYRECGPQGEPSVAYVDQENDFAMVELAPNFAAFIASLVDKDELDGE